MPFQRGSFVGPYEIVMRLGAGGMGEVHRAYEPRLNREVAIKVLTDEATQAVSRLAAAVLPIRNRYRHARRECRS